MKNRSSLKFLAWSIVEDRGNKLALFSGEVPIYWSQKVAQDRADYYNYHGFKVHVEKVEITRTARKQRSA